MCAWVVAELGQFKLLGPLLSFERWNWLSQAHGEERDESSQMWRASSLIRSRTSFPKQGSSGSGEFQGRLSCVWGVGAAGHSGPVRGGARSAEPSNFDTCFPWAPVVTRATDVYTYPNCCRTTDPEVVIGSSLELDVTMAPSGSAGLSDPDVTSNSVVPGLQPSPRWRLRSQTVIWPNGNGSHRPQHRLWLWQVHQLRNGPKPRTGPKPHLRYRCQYSHGWQCWPR